MAAPALWRKQRALTECQAQFAYGYLCRAFARRAEGTALEIPLRPTRFGAFRSDLPPPRIWPEPRRRPLDARFAHDIARLLPAPVVVAELGSGNGTNTRWLLEAIAARHSVDYFPIDISAQALSRCRQELGQLDRVSLSAIEAPYLEGLSQVAERRRDERAYVSFFFGQHHRQFRSFACSAFSGTSSSRFASWRCFTARHRS